MSTNLRIISLLFLVLLSGCGTKSTSSSWFDEPDTSRLKQKVGPEVDFADNTAQFDAQNYRQRWFSPWQVERPSSSFNGIHWARSYARTTTYNRQAQVNSAAHWQAVLANTNEAGFASVMQNGIAIRGSALRALPTMVGAFKDASRPGEGYPFDYLANAHLKVNTPVKILNYSSDRRWALVQTPWIPSWVEASAVAPIDPALSAALQSMDLGVVIDEVDARPEMRIGTLMFAKGERYFQAAAGAGGQAQLIDSAAKRASIKPFPLPFSDEMIEHVANQLIGEGYGWGEIDFMRDCSSMTRDFFGVFGRFLPRNSKAQAAQGTPISVKGFSKEMKQQILRDQAPPFQTLIYLPGHIMIYIGERDGELLALHNVWGVRTFENGVTGRWVMGKGVVTSLEPGRHLAHYDADRSSLLNRASKFVILKH